MISRRNIRVKVMQTLYTLATLETEQKTNGATASRMLDDKLAQALDLFVISILYTFRVAEYAQSNALQRSNKYLVTEADKNVSTKIAENLYLKKTYDNATFAAKISIPKIEHSIDEEQVKKAFLEVVKTPEYEAYIAAESRDPQQERTILQFIWEKHILGSEFLQDFFNDELPGWEDDKEMIVMLMDNFFKSTGKMDFSALLSAEKKQYAHELLQTVLDKEEYCTELIQPKLKNWDSERVAYIDILLLRMGICEMVYFPTIPTKVTINEYIEVAKLYSTPQSGQFINGVLDNILKDLTKENKIKKEERTRK